MILICEQPEGQVILRLELDVTFHAIRADAQDDRVPLFDLRVVVPKATGLGGASTGHVLRIEKDHDALAPVVAQAHDLAVIGRDGEVRRGRTDGGHVLRDFFRLGHCSQLLA